MKIYALTKLTFMQMMHVGVHIGHTLRASKFLTYGIYSSGRGDIFIINLVKTTYVLRMSLDSIYMNSYLLGAFGFVNLNKYFGSYIYRYALLSGETYSIYHGIPGTITNFRKIVSGYYILIRLLSETKYNIRHRDKRKLGYIPGFFDSRNRIPSLAFLSNMLETGISLSEFSVARVPCISIIDSNILSWGIALPVAGNDDSVLCLNFYCYIVTRAILVGKAAICNEYKERIYLYNNNRKRITKLRNNLLVLYLYNYDSQFDLNLLNKILHLESKSDENAEPYFDVHEKIFDISLTKSLFLGISNYKSGKRLKPKENIDPSDGQSILKILKANEAYNLF